MYLRAEPDGRAIDQYFRLTGEAEHRLFQNVWLQFAVGGENGRVGRQNRLFVLSNVTFSFDRRQ